MYLTSLQYILFSYYQILTKKLSVPLTKKKIFAERSYSATAPLWWNDLPNFIKQSPNTEVLKKQLKTFLFNKF